MTTTITGSVLLKDGSVTAAKLADDSITSDKIADNAIIENAYSDNSIPSAAYKAQSIATSALADDAVTGAKIADNTISSNHYANTSIPTAAYQLLSVTTAILANDAVTSAKLADDSVGSEHLIDDSVIRAAIGSAAVGTDEIEDYKVTPAKLEKGTQGDILVATGGDGTFTRLNAGDDGAVLSMQSGVPAWTGNVLPSGVIMDWCGQSAPDGWVMANGRAIGNASSGASGRANDDTEALFLFLWANFADAQLAVSGGRGASAQADFDANKTIALPDLRGRMTVGRDSMGSSSAGRITTATATAGGNIMGATGGVERVTLTEAQMPTHKHFSAADNGLETELGGSYSYVSDTVPIHIRGRDVSGLDYYFWGYNAILAPTVGPTSETGGSQPHSNMAPFFVLSKIIKL
jgi:microcystin-dependent protein